MTAAKFTQPNSTAQDATAYKNALETAALIHNAVAGAFNVRASDTPGLSIVIEAGAVYTGATIIEAGAQTISGIAAPATNPRIDIIEIDPITSTAYRVAGTEAITPVKPAVTAGRVPLAYYQIGVGATAVTNAMIMSVRSIPWGAWFGGNADTLSGRNSASFAHSEIKNTEDLNSITQSGMYRIQGGNVNTPAGAGYGQLLVMHGGGDTITQIVTDYISSNIYWRSGNPSNVGGAGTWGAWRTVWHNGNDGAGSGLDADTVRGSVAQLVPAAVSGFVGGGYQTVASDDGTFGASLAIKPYAAAGAWKSFGPTGSGAGQVWSAFDAIPVGAAAIRLRVVAENWTDLGLVHEIFARKTGSVSTYNSSTMIGSVNGFGTAYKAVSVSMVDVPLDLSRRFDLYWDAQGSTVNINTTIEFVGWVI